MKKSNQFVLIIDKDREDILNVLFNVFNGTGNMTRFFQTKRGSELRKIFFDFVEEISEKTHGQGWCRDPNCPDLRGININKQIEKNGT